MEGSDEFREIFCEPCGKIQQKATADGFCIDCSEYLCGQCFNHHKRFKQFEHHVLQDKNSMPLDPKNTVSKYVCTSKCQVHADEVIKYICKTCDKIGCNVCMTINHRSCDGVRYIPDEVKKSDTSVEIREFAKMIDDMIEEQTKLYVKIDQNFQLSDEMNTIACKDIEQQKDQIVTFFENLYDKIKTEVVGKQVADKKVFETLLKEVSIMQTDLKNRKARLQTLEQAQQICEAFIFMKYTQAAMGKMSSDMKELSESGKEKPARYQPSLDVEELKEDIKCLGCLFTGESDQITQIESVKKKMEKELHMIRREKEDLKDVLDRTNAIAEDLKKNVNELQTCVHKEKQNNKHLKTEKENQKLDYESRLNKVKQDSHSKDIQLKKEQEELRRVQQKQQKRAQEELTKMKEEFRTKEIQLKKEQEELRRVQEKQQKRDQEELTKMKEDQLKKEQEELRRVQEEQQRKDQGILTKMKEELRRVQEELNKVKQDYHSKDIQLKKEQEELCRVEEKLTKMKEEFRTKDIQFKKEQEELRRVQEELQKEQQKTHKLENKTLDELRKELKDKEKKEIQRDYYEAQRYYYEAQRQEEEERRQMEEKLCQRTEEERNPYRRLNKKEKEEKERKRLEGQRQAEGMSFKPFSELCQRTEEERYAYRRQGRQSYQQRFSRMFEEPQD